MKRIIKSISILVLLFPVIALGQLKLQNNTFEISATGDIEYNFVHAFMFKEDTSITPNCPGTTVYVKILPKFVTGYGLVENDGFTITGDSITVITPGDYYAVLSYTLTGPNNTDWKFAFFKNSVKQYGTRRTTSGATNYSGGTTPFYFAGLVAGDDISIKVANLTAPGTDDPTITNINLFIYKMPE